MEVDKKVEDIDLLYIFKKSIPISLNFFLDKIPFTITLIIFKNLNQRKNQESLALVMSYKISVLLIYKISKKLSVLNVQNLLEEKIINSFGIIFLSFVL